MSAPVDASFDAIEQLLREDCMASSIASSIASSQDDDLAIAAMDPAEFAKEMESILSTLGSDSTVDFEKGMEALFSFDDISAAPELQRSDSSASSTDFDKDIEAALSFFESVTTADSTASSDTEPEAVTPPIQAVALSDVLVNTTVPSVAPKTSTVEIVPIAASPVKAKVVTTNPIQHPTMAPHPPTYFPQQPLPSVYASSPFAMPMPAPEAYVRMMQEQAIVQAQMQMQMQAQAYAQMAAFFQYNQHAAAGRIARSSASAKRNSPYARNKRDEKNGWNRPIPKANRPAGFVPSVLRPVPTRASVEQKPSNAIATQ